MTNREKSSLARIISDMIKADNIIEEREIREMKFLMEKYGITNRHMAEAREMRFSDAVNELRNLDAHDRHDIFDRIYRLAMSDNTCVQKEALLLIALKYCLVDVHEHALKKDDGKLVRPKLLSCPSGESTINEPYIVYIESVYEESPNMQIMDSFKLMVTSSKLHGFNFIYIPELVKEFQNMSERYVLDVIRYMAPSLKDDFIKNVYDRLSCMTTKEFFRNVLYERLNVKMDYDIVPSLLINIGTSVVPYCVADGPVQYYTEFLCIPLYKEPLNIVEDVLNFYRKMVSFQQSVIVGDNQGNFRYFGFYKALFDFLIAPPPVEPDLIFAGQNVKTNRYEVIFRYNERYEKTIVLSPKEYHIYYDIAKLGWNIQRRGTIASDVSHIKNCVDRGIMDVLFRDKYKPCRVGNIYGIDVEKNKVFERVYKDLLHKEFVDKPFS